MCGECEVCVVRLSVWVWVVSVRCVCGEAVSVWVWGEAASVGQQALTVHVCSSIRPSSVCLCVSIRGHHISCQQMVQKSCL